MIRIEKFENQITCINGTLLCWFIQILIYWLRHCLAGAIWIGHFGCQAEKSEWTTKNFDILHHTRTYRLSYINWEWLCTLIRMFLAPVLFRFRFRFLVPAILQTSKGTHSLATENIGFSRDLHRSTVNSLSNASSMKSRSKHRDSVHRIF